MQRFLQLPSCLIGAAFILTGLIFSSNPAQADFLQQGPKLVGGGSTGTPGEGFSVAVSGDGNTAIIGGPGDNGDAGAAWVFTRSGSTWMQQGKLFGAGAVGNAGQGRSVSLSADGNTAIIGGKDDNGGDGAAWVFTRSGSTWMPQGKLFGAGATGTAQQGWSVALSADGNTAIIGGLVDNGEAGAAWVFTRSGSSWMPQGGKLVGSGASGSAQQGYSVALSGDGNTVLIGGPEDNSGMGATWVFTRSGGWTQYGNRLVGTFGSATARQGWSVALSSDGTTALIGGPDDTAGDSGAAWVFTLVNGTWTQQTKLSDEFGSGAMQGSAVALSGDGNTALLGGPSADGDAGATWVFTRIGSTWTEQRNNRSKLVGSGAAGAAQQGDAVALSADGTTAVFGGVTDNNSVGAAWVFIRRATLASTHDFNSDGFSDIAWRQNTGSTAVWLLGTNGIVTEISQTGGLGSVPTNWQIVGERDFNGDGKADLLWRDTSGNTSMWFINATSVASSASVANVPTNWTVVGVADFNGDGLGDLLWRDNIGDIAVWLMNGATVSSSAALGNVPTNWTVVGTGDFNGDGMADLLWRDNLGNTAIWFMSGTTVVSSAGVGNIPTNWSVVGTGDFNGDGKSDIVWRDTVGDTSIWLMNGATVLTAGALGNVPTTWSVAQTGDYNGDGMSDLLWRDNLGNTSMWFMNGTAVASTAGVGDIPTNWTVQSTNAE
jgi:FG-GAP-like repeat